MLKLADNPPGLTPGYASVGALPGRWGVAHTKARSEKAFAFDCLSIGVGHFLPMRRRVTVSGGRTRHGLIPLFGGYVFFCGGEDARHRVLATHRLCQVIEVADQTRLVRELAALERALAGGLELNLYAGPRVGHLCRVTGGPLKGHCGILVRRQGAARLVLEVGILGQGVLVEVDDGLLEQVEQHDAVGAGGNGLGGRKMVG
jgi:hypothetical protein